MLYYIYIYISLFMKVMHCSAALRKCARARTSPITAWGDEDEQDKENEETRRRRRMMRMRDGDDDEEENGEQDKEGEDGRE